MAIPAVVQFEITGKNSATLKSFYGTLFGWQAQEVGITPGYGVVRTEKGIPGGIGPSWDGGSGHATFYVEVDDIQECLSLAEELGGRLSRRRGRFLSLALRSPFSPIPKATSWGYSTGSKVSC